MRLLFVLYACGTVAPAPIAVPVSEPAVLPDLPPEKVAAFDPLAGLTLAEVCSDQFLSLIRWDYEELHGNFRGLCCHDGGLTGDAANDCEYDWPFSDVPSCEAYDVLRNGIMARYGYPFTQPKWQEHFAGADWYRRRDDFDAAWLSGAAKRNVEELKRRKAAKIACMD